METSFLQITLYAASLGVTMKLADLLDEHGLKLFKGDALLFGILWGGFASLLLWESNTLANFVLALSLSWVFLYRVDYLNHGVGYSILFLSFLFTLPSFVVDWSLFLIIFVTYSFHEYFDIMSDEDKLTGVLAKYFTSGGHYILIPAVLVFYSFAYLPVLVASSLYIIFYKLTKQFGKRSGYL